VGGSRDSTSVSPDAPRPAPTRVNVVGSASSFCCALRVTATCMQCQTSFWRHDSNLASWALLSKTASPVAPKQFHRRGPLTRCFSSRGYRTQQRRHVRTLSLTPQSHKRGNKQTYSIKRSLQWYFSSHFCIHSFAPLK
jgi:hypothetical protein